MHAPANCRDAMAQLSNGNLPRSPSCSAMFRDRCLPAYIGLARWRAVAGYKCEQQSFMAHVLLRCSHGNTQTLTPSSSRPHLQSCQSDLRRPHEMEIPQQSAVALRMQTRGVIDIPQSSGPSCVLQHVRHCDPPSDRCWPPTCPGHQATAEG